MKVIKTAIEDVVIIEPDVFGDLKEVPNRSGPSDAFADVQSQESLHAEPDAEAV